MHYVYLHTTSAATDKTGRFHCPNFSGQIGQGPYLYAIREWFSKTDPVRCQLMVLVDGNNSFDVQNIIPRRQEFLIQFPLIQFLRKEYILSKYLLTLFIDIPLKAIFKKIN